MKEQFNANEKWQLDGYRWIKQDGLYLPADDNWRPLDLNPLPLSHPPIAGDICYVNVHPDCSNCPFDEPTISRQLALVTISDDIGEDCEACIHLVSPKVSMATSQDMILAPQETRIPFNIMVSTVFVGPVFFSQLSQPVGFCDPETVDMFIPDLDFSHEGPDFSGFNMGRAIIDEKNDSRIDYEQKRNEICKKLSCYLFSMDSYLEGDYDNIFSAKPSKIKIQDIDIDSDYNNFFNNS